MSKSLEKNELKKLNQDYNNEIPINDDAKYYNKNGYSIQNPQKCQEKIFVNKIKKY